MAIRAKAKHIKRKNFLIVHSRKIKLVNELEDDLLITWFLYLILYDSNGFDVANDFA